MEGSEFPLIHSDEHIKATTVVCRVTAILTLEMCEKKMGPRTAEYIISMVGRTLRYRIHTYDN